MKTKLFLFILISLIGCSPKNKADIDKVIKDNIESGNFTIVSQIIDSITEDDAISEKDRIHYLFIKDSLYRVRLDFNKTIDDIVSWIALNHEFTPSSSMITEWENELSLEYRIIDGEKRYFRNAAPNLFRVNANALALSKKSVPKTDVPRDELLVNAFIKKDNTETNYHYLLPPVSFKINYTITVKPDVVNAGEIVRAWLPYPRTDISRQYNVSLVQSSQEDYVLSNNRTEHNSVYMEKRAVDGEPTSFYVIFKMTSQGEWFDLEKSDIEPYNINSDEYKFYTSERAPHIVFTDKLKSITDSVVGESSQPLEILQRCYSYVASNYPWASALEYSTIKNISEYAIDNRKGDCGQVAILLISMLRYKGIPAHWQSGWMLHPGEENLHDWAEVYFKGIGWVPVDISFARGGHIPIEPGREFFMSGIDSYRLYLNSDYSGQFFPDKKYPRSETVDFQRGEVETLQGNLYFDKWSYSLEIL